MAGARSRRFGFQLRNPRIWENIQERVGSLRGRRFGDVAGLKAAEALAGRTRATQAGYRNNSVTVRIRPPRCEHGGYTRAVS